MSESYLPRYTERPGEQVFQPPYVAQGARLHLCFVDGGVDELNDLLDGSLNAVLAARSPGSARFRATGQRMIFMFAEIEKMYSEASEYLSFVKQQTAIMRSARATMAGEELRKREDEVAAEAREQLAQAPFVREIELGIWVPISRLAYGQLSPAFYLPFVFNGTPASVVTGREVYGYPKQLAFFERHPEPGDVSLPDPPPLQAVTMSTWHRRTKSDPEYTDSKLLTITLPSDAAVPFPEGQSWQSHAVESLRHRAAPRVPRVRIAAPRTTTIEREVAGNPWDDFVNRMVRGAPLCFLRQFRDPVSPPDATLQQIIAARFVIQQTPRFKTLGAPDRPGSGGDILFEPSETLDLWNKLGLTWVDEENGRRRVSIQNTVVIEGLDFTVDLGKVLG